MPATTAKTTFRQKGGSAILAPHSHTSPKSLRIYVRALVGFVLAVLWVGMFLSILVVSKRQSVTEPHRQRQPTRPAQHLSSSQHFHRQQVSPIAVDVAYLYVNGSAHGFAESVLRHADPSKVPFGQLVEREPNSVAAKKARGYVTVDPTGRMAGAVSHNHPRFRDWGELYYSLSTLHSRFPACSAPIPEDGRSKPPNTTTTCRGDVYVVVSSPAHIPSYCRVHGRVTLDRPSAPSHRPQSCRVCFPRNNDSRGSSSSGGNREHTTSKHYHACLEVLLRYHHNIGGLSLPTFNSNALEVSIHDLLLPPPRYDSITSNGERSPTTTTTAKVNTNSSESSSSSRWLMVMNDDMLLGTTGIEECILATTTAADLDDTRTDAIHPKRGRYNNNGVAIPPTSSQSMTLMWYVERTHVLRVGCLRAALSILSSGVGDREGLPSYPALPPMYRVVDVCAVSTSPTSPKSKRGPPLSGAPDPDGALSGGALAGEGVDSGSEEASVHHMSSFTIRAVLRLQDALLPKDTTPPPYFYFHSFAHTPKVMDRCVLEYFFPVQLPSDPTHQRWGASGMHCNPSPAPPLPRWWMPSVVHATRSHRFRSGVDLWVPLVYPYLAELYYHLIATQHDHQLKTPTTSPQRHQLQVMELYVPPPPASATSHVTSSSESSMLPPHWCYTDSYYYGALSNAEAPSAIYTDLFHRPMMLPMKTGSTTSSSPSSQDSLRHQLMKAGAQSNNTTPSPRATAPLFTTINDDLPYLAEEDGALARVRHTLATLLATIAFPHSRNL